MLAATLKSISELVLPEDSTLSVVIVENDLLPRSRHVVEHVQKTTPFPLKYYLEPRIGIPYARNRSLSGALAEGADWIAMLDDDETAQPNWLTRLYDACRTFNADVATGSVRQVPEVTPPHWWKPLSELGKPTGFLRRDAYTNNVIFNAKLIAPDGYALRFDNRLTFGADDVDFFRRAHVKGARIVTVADSLVTERVSASRLTVKRALNRTFMVAAANSYLGVLTEGRMNTTLKRFPSIIRRSLIGILLLIGGAVAWPIKKLSAEKMLFKGTSSLTKAYGSLHGLVGGRSRYYGHVDGV